MLINCPECGKRVSSEAKACPECGYPISSNISNTMSNLGGNDYKENNGNDLIIDDQNITENTAIDAYEEDDLYDGVKKKQSKLGIVALIITLLGGVSWFCFAASITLIVIDLVGRNHKKTKHTFSYIAIGFTVLVLISLFWMGSHIKKDSYEVDLRQETELSPKKIADKTPVRETKADDSIQDKAEESPSLMISNGTELGVGSYVIGEDINAGKYDIEAISGTGEIRLYNSYDDYKNDEYGYDAIIRYDMKAIGASVGLLNDDIYSNYLSNIRVENGECLVVDQGLKVQYAESNNDLIDNGTITTGIYVVGDDIKEDSYKIVATSGMGEVLIYKTYTDFLNDDHGYDARESYDMRADGASVGLLNEDIYTDSIGNIYLKADNCLVVKKGLSLELYSDEKKKDNSTLLPGVYIVGDDLESGKYNFTAEKGMGELLIYGSYDVFCEDKHGFDAEESYDLLAPGADPGLTNPDVYTESVNNIHLSDGQCVVVKKGIVLSYR